MEDYHVVVLNAGVAGYSLDIYIFPFHGIEHVEQACAVSQLVYQHVIAGGDGRLHGIGGDFVRAEDEYAQQDEAEHQKRGVVEDVQPDVANPFHYFS